MEVSDQINLALVVITVISIVISAIASTISFFLSRQHADQLFHNTKFPELRLETQIHSHFAASRNDLYQSSLVINVKNMNLETMVQDLEGILYLEARLNWRKPIKAKYGTKLYKSVLEPLEVTSFDKRNYIEVILRDDLKRHVISETFSTNYEFHRYTQTEPITALAIIKYRSGLLNSRRRQIEFRITLKPPIIGSENPQPNDWIITKTVRKDRWVK